MSDDGARPTGHGTNMPISYILFLTDLLFAYVYFMFEEEAETFFIYNFHCRKKVD